MNEKIKKIKSGAIGLSKYTLGIDKSEKSEKQTRFDICKMCTKLQKTNHGIQKFKYKCSVCGCFIIPKISINSEKCPLKKW